MFWLTILVVKLSVRTVKVIIRSLKEILPTGLEKKLKIHDAILTAMDNLVLPRVKMAVRSIT